MKKILTASLALALASCGAAAPAGRVNDMVLVSGSTLSDAITVWHDSRRNVTCYKGEGLSCMSDFEIYRGDGKP